MPAKKKKPPKDNPWRLCPGNEYWRNEHIQGDYTKADGTEVRAHHVRGCCCRRPSGKDQLYSDEIDDIAKEHFASVKRKPNLLPKKGKWAPNDPNKFDNDFAGWTKYWNDVMNEKDPLDPNIVKALAASEGMFDPKPKDQKTKNSGYARGLFQLTDKTREILEDEKGELKDHFVHIDGNEVYDPNVSTAGAIRWLYYKRSDATRILKRKATWDEAVQNYKGALGKSEKVIKDNMTPFREILAQLKKSK